MNNLQEDWTNVTKIKMFEIEVTNIKTGELDYIVCDIDMTSNKFIGSHVGLTDKMDQSNKIDTSEIELDLDFSLDENLQELYSECIQNIIDGDLYDIK